MAEPSFEEAMARLETIVQELEEGEANLERSLSLFEEGIKLSKLCHKKLDQAEKKIELLIKKGDASHLRRPLGEGEEEKDLLNSVESAE